MAILREPRRRVVPIAVAALVLAAAISAGSFYRAAGDTHGETYYACLYAGTLSQVGTTQPANCGRGTLVSWNAAGQQGLPGEAGEDGINCWDLNGNRVNDPEEDINQDSAFDAEDCTGPEGPQGEQGEQGPPGPSNALDCEGCVDTSDIAAGAIVGGTGGVVQDGSLTADDLAPGSVSGGPEGVIVDGSVTEDDLADGSVAGGPGGVIADGSVTADDLAGGSVPTSKQVANTAQSAYQSIAIGSLYISDATSTVTLSTQDTAAHVVHVTGVAYLRCYETCDVPESGARWTLLAGDGESATAITPTVSGKLTGEGDVLTVAVTHLHVTTSEETVYSLHIEPTGSAWIEVTGFTVTAVDLGRAPVP